MQKVIVASHNPTKIQATRLAFQAMFPSQPFSFESVSVPSDVRAQPLSDAETLQGATNRARNARGAQPDADIWVGLEGGVAIDGEDLWSFAWVVVLTQTLLGRGKTGTVQLPKRVAQLVAQGMELGEADDIVFGRHNSKQAEGAVGLLTAGIIDRTLLYRDAVVFALVPLKNPDLYLA
jgi:inosine/xanthosine triphosphatase